MIRYADSSALAKRYIEEPASPLVGRLLAEAPLATSRLSEAEVASAIVRRWREGSFSMEVRERAFAALHLDLAVLNVVELLPAVSSLAVRLLRRHVLRAADSLQLASAIYLQEKAGASVEFMTFDRRLAEAALAEGLAVTGAV